MNEYDAALKGVLRKAPLLIEQLAGGGPLKWLNIELAEVQKLRVDLLGESPDGELVHIELQSTNDNDMPIRMLEYCSGILKNKRRVPRQIVLYVGEPRLKMKSELRSPGLRFEYDMVDIRTLDGDMLVASDYVGDNVIAILARLRDSREAVRRIITKLAVLQSRARETAFGELAILAGLRRMEGLLAEEVRTMPILDDIRDHAWFRELRAEGAHDEGVSILRLQIAKRFGAIPDWAEKELARRTTAEIEALSVRLFDVQSVEELFIGAH